MTPLKRFHAPHLRHYLPENQQVFVIEDRLWTRDTRAMSQWHVVLTLLIVLMISCIFFWHLYLAAGTLRYVQEANALIVANISENTGIRTVAVSLNPFTNVVKIMVVRPPRGNDALSLWEHIGFQIGSTAIFDLVKKYGIEKKCNAIASKNFDFYAFLIPYSSQIIFEENEL